ncbi:hypothetical protein PLICRDRAFT_34060 [Plicaturopsis crispa FD-325 SS-3]|nr:hypothetical protein PLICRDRAFT_34060 [Plicaturopsis crispa FD-325 SS-3]
MFYLAALLLLPVALAAYTPPFVVQDGDAHFAPLDDVKVPVVLGVMSKCPDALLCESVFEQVLKRVSDKVDISLTYVGKIDESEPEFGVTCLHGPDECAGNVQQLCAAKYAPDQWWHFVQCQNYQGRAKVGTPEVALKCAQASGIDWETSPVGQCAGLDGAGRGAEGIKLLQNSVKATAELGIQKSCTILINWKQVCIHDGTWKECEEGHAATDFIRQINNEYDRINDFDGAGN